MPDLIRHPEVIEFTGLRVKLGMTEICKLFEKKDNSSKMEVELPFKGCLNDRKKVSKTWPEFLLSYFNACLVQNFFKTYNVEVSEMNFLCGTERVNENEPY